MKPGMRSDGELLCAHLAGDQDAFHELVQRHGTMVFSSCRRVLGMRNEVEDAVQAVFIALAENSRRLQHDHDVGAWLHRVARYTSMTVLRGLKRRAHHEKEASLMKETVDNAPAHAAWDAVQPWLDESINALPSKYRKVLVACYLEGRSQSQMAAILRMPEGTIATRCRRGLEKLRRQLQRRGLTVEASSLAPLLLNHSSGVLPAHLAVAANCAKTGLVANQVASIVAETHKTMVWVQLKALLAAVILAAGLGVAATRA